jgi:CRP/FNR family transcriptional regulator, cyclic AMP receptor protein
VICDLKAAPEGCSEPPALAWTLEEAPFLDWRVDCRNLQNLGQNGVGMPTACGFWPELGDMALERILKRSRFAGRLSAPHRETLGAMGRRIEFDEDQLILQARQRSTHFYLLVSGSVCVEVRTPVYTVCVQVLGPGDAFGWSSFLDHHDTLFQVRAREASRVICWDALPLFDACRKNPEFGLELYTSVLEVVAGRVKATESKLAEFCGSSR